MLPWGCSPPAVRRRGSRPALPSTHLLIGSVGEGARNRSSYRVAVISGGSLSWETEPWKGALNQNRSSPRIASLAVRLAFRPLCIWNQGPSQYTGRVCPGRVTNRRAPAQGPAQSEAPDFPPKPPTSGGHWTSEASSLGTSRGFWNPEPAEHLFAPPRFSSDLKLRKGFDATLKG